MNSDVRTIHKPQKKMRTATDDLPIDLVLKILHLFSQLSFYPTHFLFCIFLSTIAPSTQLTPHIKLVRNYS